MNTRYSPLSTKSDKICSKKLPFTSSERDLIVALVRERPIIEDKRTHAQNIALKKKAWDELTIAYNTHSYVTPRNNIQLKRCWENFKTQRKKELYQEALSMSRTDRDPLDGGPATSSGNVDALYPFINITVPGVINSNSIESDLKPSEVEKIKIQPQNNVLDRVVGSGKPMDKSFDKKIDTNFCDSKNFAEVMNMDTNCISEVNENVPSQPKKRKDICTTSTGFKFTSEIEARIKRSTMNMPQDSELHELRMRRERLLIKREENLIEYEKQLHSLQLEKLKIEIELLKKP